MRCTLSTFLMSVILSMSLPSQAQTISQLKALDVFGLSMQVTPDTVSCINPTMTVLIKFENRTGQDLEDFEIQAFFPSQTERFTRFQDVIYAPAYVKQFTTDLNRIDNAKWLFDKLANGQKDSIQFRLSTEWHPRVDISFTHTVTARARDFSTS